MKKAAPIFLLWALLFGANQFLPQSYEAMRPNLPTRGKIDVMLDLIGETRTMLARYLWYYADNMHELREGEGAYAFKEDENLTVMVMVTKLDPYLDEAYDIVAWDLYKGYERKDEALAVLREGVIFNPKSFLLNWRLSFVLFAQKKFAEAIPPGELALVEARDDIDQLNTIRILFRSYEEVKDWNAALTMIDLWLKLRPGDLVPTQERPKILKQLGRAA